MTKAQFKKLIKHVSHMEINNEVYEVSKNIECEPILTASHKVIWAMIGFTTKALMSGEIDSEGSVYIKERAEGVNLENNDIEFIPLTTMRIF